MPGHQGEDCDQDRQHDHPLAGAVERMRSPKGSSGPTHQTSAASRSRPIAPRKSGCRKAEKKACHRGSRLNL
jgi:hypothetical protein